MKKWYKYFLDEEGSNESFRGRDLNFQDHQKAMEGYAAEIGYSSKEDFFKTYVEEETSSRIKIYDQFIRAHVDKDVQVLSIASGRSANELFLVEDGYDVVCSDLDYISAYEETKKLFPGYKFYQLDILKDPVDKLFNTILALNLIYTFDDQQLSVFFKNVNASLKPKGQLILEAGGSPDNWLTRFLHGPFLKVEIQAKRFYYKRKYGKQFGIITKDHGYRRTDKEIIQMAEKAGFRLLNKKTGAFLYGFYRSGLFYRMIQSSRICRKIFYEVGKLMPHVRMFNFQKIN